MQILLISATSYEQEFINDYLNERSEKKSFVSFTLNGHTITPLVTGVGSAMTSYALGRLKDSGNIGLAIHLGLSGTYDRNIILGSVVEVIEDRWVDIGAEEQNGDILNLEELNLVDKNQFPFINGWINKKHKGIDTGLEQKRGITVNTVSGTQQRIDFLNNKYKADVENMEGASIFYCCRMWDIPFVSIRGISNYVEPRNKSKWKLAEANIAMQQYVIGLLKQYLEEKK